jgi:hypothetical protein
VFNVSACVWNQGAQENIVTITSKDSDSSAGGGSSSSGSPNLSRGAIAGIIVACVIVGILLAIAAALVILRKRRKWMKAGFAAVATKTEPDDLVLQGPVFNSAARSTAGTSTPRSTADIAAPRSTGECSRLADSPAAPTAVGETVAGGAAVELDARDTHIRPSTELDGKEIHIQRPVAKNPGVYELPGSAAAGGKSKEAELDRPRSTVVALPSGDERETGNESPPSPYISTLGTTWGQDGRPDSELVSPVTYKGHLDD